MKQNISSIQHFIDANAADRSKLIMDFTYRRVSWQDMFDGLIQLDKELDEVYHNWLANERIIIGPLNLHDNGGDNYFWFQEDWTRYRIPADWDDSNSN